MSDVTRAVMSSVERRVQFRCGVSGRREEVATAAQVGGWRGDSPERTGESEEDGNSWWLLFPEEE